MTRPDVLDNIERTHADGLAYLVGDLPARHGLSIATGYVNVGGLHHLATVVADGWETRLLLGALPEQGLGEKPPLLSFEQRMQVLAGERDLARFPPSRAAERLQAIEAWLSRPGVEVKRYVEKFLHGKAYLFGSVDDPRAALVTSANLTGAGLHANLELGVVDYNVGASGKALAWFDALWERAAPFRDELRDLLFPAIGLVDPQTIYLRALLELYGDELRGVSATEITRVKLATFQRDGYERARRILQRHGGVVYADGVGTGKTEIGLAFIEEVALEQGRLALVICPAQLREGWRKRIAQARLPAEVLSFNELASDEQLAPDAAAPKRHLAADKDAYRLVVVDEAHALRSEDTTWYASMGRLLGGERKKVVLLTATPVNNGLWDLFNLVMLFAHHDRAFTAIGVPSLRKLFVAAGANSRDPETLDPDLLFPIADAVSVRRDRAFIQQRYPGEVFSDGTPVRFPEPRAETRRYDLDARHPVVHGVVEQIAELEMARYRPSAWLLDPVRESAETALGGLLQSQLLKRFESSWHACLATVERMIQAHDAFLEAWERGVVLSRQALLDAAHADASEAGISTWVEQTIAESDDARPVADFQPTYADAVARDRARLTAIRNLLQTVRAETDPKLQLLRELLETSPAEKIAVFATYGETIEYLDAHLASTVGGRDRVVVVGGTSSPDERTRLISRFAPKSVVGPDYVPADGEVGLLLSTDVLSEGQNLQQAQAVISFDMPWNPQRVVQRNGRVIRLLSPHDEVFLTTMLPKPGDLEEMLRLETRVRAKIRAAGVYGMEVEVIDGIESDLRQYAERLAGGDVELLADEDDGLSGAFLGELLRAKLLRAHLEGELARIQRLPWGIGAAFRQAPGGRSRGVPGIFFATRTQGTSDAPSGYRYWRYVEAESCEVLDSDLELLRRIDPEGAEPVDIGGLDLEAAWSAASASIVEEHNRRADPRAAQDAIGPAQRFALELLRDPTVILPEGAERAADALAVERSSAVRRALNEIAAETREERISRNEGARKVVELVERLGLQPVPVDDVPSEITEDDLGVVCWMAVLPPR